jgi:hypothetical protein
LGETVNAEKGKEKGYQTDSFVHNISFVIITNEKND